MNFIKYIFLFSLLVLLSCKNNKNPEDQNQESEVHADDGSVYVSKVQFDNSKMELSNTVEKEFAKTVHTNGIIDVPPQSMAVISAFSGGYIKNTPLLIGDKVKKGQRLVTIENPEFITMQQNYLETAGQLSYLKSEYERQKTMFEENITSQRNFLKAESEYKIAGTRYNSLKKNLEMLNINPATVDAGTIVSQVNIYSPIDGNVTNVFVSTGTYVSPADKILEVMNTDHIHLELKIFEKDLMQLKKGQEILFKVPEASNEKFTGLLHLIGKTIDPKSRIAMIHGHIEDKDEINFVAGMFVEADIVTGKSTHMALPDDALIELEGTHYVLMLESEDSNGYKFRRVEVKIENSYKGFTSFSSSLALDGKYLTKGGFALLQIEGSGGH